MRDNTSKLVFETCCGCEARLIGCLPLSPTLHPCTHKNTKFRLARMKPLTQSRFPASSWKSKLESIGSEDSYPKTSIGCENSYPKTSIDCEDSYPKMSIAVDVHRLNIHLIWCIQELCACDDPSVVYQNVHVSDLLFYLQRITKSRTIKGRKV